MIAATSWGKILKSSDGGKNWVEKHSETGEIFADICFIDNLNGFAVSGHSKIYRTTDGGETWTVTQVGYFKEYTHIHFINATTGWISGSDGYMLRTTDGGTTWNPVYIGTHQSQNVVYFFDEQNGFLAGNGGMLLHTSNGGFTSIPITYPSAKNKPELTLFPNPCREAAFLQYELPTGAKVLVQVFAVSGKQVLSLDIGWQSRGKHQVSFIAKELPSGVYFCQLRADGVVETKKMIVKK